MTEVEVVMGTGAIACPCIVEPFKRTNEFYFRGRY
jgi:hypothetical protein